MSRPRRLCAICRTITSERVPQANGVWAHGSCRECRVPGCDGRARSRGYCNAHYLRSWKTGSPLPVRRPIRTCSVSGCDRRHYGKSFCKRHFDRFVAHGSPTIADELTVRQGGKCAICRRPARGRGHEGRLHYDHDPASGLRRGMLCGPCNKALGLLGDDPDLLRAALDYLLAAARVAA